MPPSPASSPTASPPHAGSRSSASLVEERASKRMANPSASRKRHRLATTKALRRPPMTSARAWQLAKPWLFLLVPLVGVAELGLHVRQTHDVVPEADWRDASAAVGKMIQPDDFVVFAPDWEDPIGRMYFGDAIMTAKR